MKIFTMQNSPSYITDFKEWGEEKVHPVGKMKVKKFKTLLYQLTMHHIEGKTEKNYKSGQSSSEFNGQGNLKPLN